MTTMNLNHAVLFVTDVDRATSFYTDVLQFDVKAREARANAVFLTAPGSGNHHDLGLFGGAGPKSTAHLAGLYHLAWEVEHVADMLEVRDRLIQNNALTGQSHHGVSISLYGADPDGNQFEVLWTIPEDEWGDFAEKAAVMPLDLDAEVARWS